MQLLVGSDGGNRVRRRGIGLCPTGGGMDGDVVAIERQVKVVLERIHRAAERSGRPPALVRLIAASKTAPVERLRDAWQAGVRHLEKTDCRKPCRRSSNSAVRM